MDSSLGKIGSVRWILDEDRFTKGRPPSWYPTAEAPSPLYSARLVPELATVWQLPANRVFDLKLGGGVTRQPGLRVKAAGAGLRREMDEEEDEDERILGMEMEAGMAAPRRRRRRPRQAPARGS